MTSSEGAYLKTSVNKLTEKITSNEFLQFLFYKSFEQVTVFFGVME